jgi:hypothetical protein
LARWAHNSHHRLQIHYRPTLCPGAPSWGWVSTKLSVRRSLSCFARFKVATVTKANDQAEGALTKFKQSM